MISYITYLFIYLLIHKFFCSTRWHSDKDIRGSYTAIAVGSSQVDIECVAQPLYSKQNANEVRDCVKIMKLKDVTCVCILN